MGDRVRLSSSGGPLRRLRARARGLASLSRARRLGGYAVAILGSLAVAIGLLPFREDISPLSKGFGFLVVVVIAAGVGGLGPGLVGSLLGFLAFNFVFLPPYGTFSIARLEYVVVLFVFLGLAVLISSLLARSMERAEAAEARERELRLLQNLSAELVARTPGSEGFAQLLDEVVRTFEFGSGALFVVDPKTQELTEAARIGTGNGELEPQSGVAEERGSVRLPLSVGRTALGLIALRGRSRQLTAAESRVLRAFCDQLALVLERDRLLRQALDARVLQQGEELRRSLLAAVSHDLRTPLATIKATITDLLAGDITPNRAYVRESLQSVNAETDRLVSLVANLLDMSRIEQGMFTPHPQVVDLPEAVTTCLDRLQRLHPAVRLRSRIEPAAAEVRADPVLLDRVLANLVENAVRASEGARERVVEVAARRDGPQVTVRVIDHGPGVPSSIREQLFYPFYQLRERHPRLGPGLGLPIAKGFLVLMGGEIWIEDTPGGGATFAFSLPVATARRAREPSGGRVAR